jgi:hypothetical protein
VVGFQTAVAPQKPTVLHAGANLAKVAGLPKVSSLPSGGLQQTK